MPTETSLLDTVIAELDKRKGHWPEVAEGAGVPYKTLQKVAYRVVKDPGISIVEKLDRWLRANPLSRAA
jgi:hypothetical protein